MTFHVTVDTTRAEEFRHVLMALDKSIVQKIEETDTNGEQTEEKRMQRASEATFAKIWDNDEDAAYDKYLGA